MEWPYQKIRSEFLNAIIDERIRMIVESNLAALPQFEDQYFEYIEKHPKYFEIYKKWVLNQSPLMLPQDDRLLYLRNEVFGNWKVGDDQAGRQVNWPVFYLLIDMTNPFLKHLVDNGLAYYSIKKSDKQVDEQIRTAIVDAAIASLLISSADDIAKEGYPDFLTSFLDKFKVLFCNMIAESPKPLPTDDDGFIGVIEREWSRLYGYSDNCYGFEVMPVLSPEDMIRFFQLPFRNKKYRDLSKSLTYRQMMNYFVSIATFKPMPDSRIKAYFRQELCKLFVPLTKNIAKRLIKKKASVFPEAELQTIVEKELSNLAQDFDFFYATMHRLDKDEVSPFQVKIFPMNRRVAKLGHIFSNDEYPFTDYVVKKLEEKMRIYFSPEIDDSNAVSLDKIYTDDEGDDMTLADTISETDTIGETHIPDYDAGKDGDHIGWKIETFARITGKSSDTLRRWDRKGYLKPQRYEIYSKIQRKKIPYRAYTRKDLAKANQIESLMQMREKHQN